MILNMKKIFIIVMVVAILIVVFIISNLKSSSTVSSQVNVGWFGPLSGPVASLGEQNLRGVQLAIKDHGKGKINLRTEDDQFNAKNSLSAYEKLKTEGVSIMLTPTYNGVMALASKADNDKVFVVNSIDASSEIAKVGKYVFGIGYYADGHGTNFARKIEESKAKKVAVFYNQGETFTELIVNAFKDEFKGEIVLIEGYKSSSTDFRTSISKMKSLNVDTVLLIGWDETGFFVRQSTELGFTPKIFGLASFTSPGFLGNAGKTNIPIYYLGWDQESKEYKEIVRKYKEEYSSEPSQPLFVALGYDSMTFILKALEKGTKPEELYSNLFETSLTGLTGTLELDDDGIVRGITTQSRLFKVE